MQARRSESVKLTKEVLPPQKAQSGLGVMLVAAAAMFFAVASSAFILRARMAAECCPLRHDVAPAAVRGHAEPQSEPAAQEPTVTVDCGEPQYHTDTEGNVSVVYEDCEPGEGPGLEDIVIVNAPESLEGGVEVHEVEPPR